MQGLREKAKDLKEDGKEMLDSVDEAESFLPKVCLKKVGSNLFLPHVYRGRQMSKDSSQCQARVAPQGCQRETAGCSKLSLHRLAQDGQILKSENNLKTVTPYQQLKDALPWWQKAGAPVGVLKLIMDGVEPDWPCPRLQKWEQPKDSEQVCLAQQVMSEYQEIGAVVEVPPPQHISVLGSLVCPEKDRKYWQRKIKVNCRLQELKQISGTKTFQIKPLAAHFSSAPKKHVGCKNRSKKCLFSLGTQHKVKRLWPHENWRKSFSVQCSLFWPKHPSTNLDGSNEGVSKKMETAGGVSIYIPRRHFGLGTKQSFVAKTFANPCKRVRRFRNDHEHRKLCAGAMSRNKSLGFSRKFQRRYFASPRNKVERHQERAWKIVGAQFSNAKKNGSNPGHSQKFSHCPALFKGFYRPNGSIYKSGSRKRMGHKITSATKFAAANQRSQGVDFILARQKIGRKSPHQKNAFRCIQFRLGRPRPHFRSGSSRILEGPKRSPYKQQRAACCHPHCSESSKARGKSLPGRRQYCGLQLPSKNGRKKRTSKCSTQAIFEMGLGKQGRRTCAASGKQRHEGRSSQQMAKRPRGLHFGNQCFHTSAKNLRIILQPPGGHVCQPRQCKTRKICGQVATSSSMGLQCVTDGSQQGGGLLCQPPLDNHHALVGEIEEESSGAMHVNGPLLGWEQVVAPTSENLQEKHTSDVNSSKMGSFHRLQWESNAPNQMAPALSDCIRVLLERKQVSPENIASYLRKTPQIGQYNKSFQTFWKFCAAKSVNVQESSLEEIALNLVTFNKIDQHMAKKAYSAILLLPGYDGLRFSPFLKECKRLWFSSQSRYATFWDADPVLRRLANTPLNWNNVQQVRDRLILVLRILQLCRSIDLERMWRTLSKVDDEYYIKIRRKGHARPAWEQIVQLPGTQRAISPLHLLLRYVALTCVCLPGSQLFRSLTPPFKPLTSNSLGRITKDLLGKLGVQISSWKPHSTRGAGVKLYKKLGLSSEQVCEIGKWKNASAFQAHYLRLGAAKAAGESIQKLGAQNSPLESAEPDWSRTPRTNQDLGGSDQEGGAQDNGEIRSLSPAVVQM